MMSPVMGGPNPMDLNGQMPAPPSAWQGFLHTISGVVNFFGRISFLVDENAHAVHFFVSALLQLLDRAGSLYGEVARFVLRILFRRNKNHAAHKAQVTNSAAVVPAGQPHFGPTPPGHFGGGHWDNVWDGRAQ